MPLSKNKIKLINSLKHKKFRKKENLFICEGIKIFDTLITSREFNIREIYATENFAKKYPRQKITIISHNELKKISTLTTPQEVIAIVEIPQRDIENENFNKGITIVLDHIQDPGNLGTIIRTADWFGIERIVCSSDSVDLYNPKVVQASMGSIFSVPVFYENLEYFFEKINKKIPVFGTLLDGENIYSIDKPSNAIILIGNEANGIRKQHLKFITKAVTIPSFNEGKAAESLNAAIATAIICSEFSKQ